MRHPGIKKCGRQLHQRFWFCVKKEHRLCCFAYHTITHNSYFGPTQNMILLLQSRTVRPCS